MVTPRQRVLKKYPKAVCFRDKFGLFVISDAKPLGGGKKEREAWADAANKISATSKERLRSSRDSR